MGSLVEVQEEKNTNESHIDIQLESICDKEGNLDMDQG